MISSEVLCRDSAIKPQQETLYPVPPTPSKSPLFDLWKVQSVLNLTSIA